MVIEDKTKSIVAKRFKPSRKLLNFVHTLLREK